MSRKVLIIEPNLTGHRGSYLKWITEAFSDITEGVSLLIPEDEFVHPSIIEFQKNSINQNIHLIGAKYDKWYDQFKGNNSFLGLILREIFYWYTLKSWYKNYSENIDHDLVFIPSLDSCQYLMGFIGSPFGDAKWSGLSMSPDFHYSEMEVKAPESPFSRVKKWLFFRLLKTSNLKGLYTTNEPLYNYIKKWCNKIYMLSEPTGPDEIFDKKTSRKELGLNFEKNYILIYGSITPRKGVESLLNSMLDSAFPITTDLILAGRMTSEANNILNKKKYESLRFKNRIILINRFIENKEESKLFSASDIIWLGYNNHYGPSGVLVQAVNAKRPVIACNQGIIGWQTNKYKIGYVIDINNTSNIVESINVILDNVDEFEFSFNLPSTNLDVKEELSNII